MASPPLLTSLKGPQRVDLARQQIERLVRQRLVGRKIDAVTFVEELLALATQVSEVRCSPVADRALRFELADCDPFEVELDGNRGKLRMLCARLAVLSQENGGDFLPYGGEGTICRTAKVALFDPESEPILYFLAWKVRWTNTPGKHEFTITVAR